MTDTQTTEAPVVDQPVEEVVDTYLAMWNETDVDRRAELIATAWVEAGHYSDPLLEAKGRPELSTMVDGLQAQFPDHTFTRTSGVDLHHGLARFGWQLAGPDGTVVIAGIDIAALAEDGKIARIAGFFGDLPARDAA
jgi:hypothetical protein